MPKITVRDTAKEFHIFKGPGVRYFLKEDGLDIIDLDQRHGENRPGTSRLAFFKDYLWMKEEAIGEDRQRITGDDPRIGPIMFDPFTTKALASHDPDERADFNILDKDYGTEGQAQSIVIKETISAQNEINAAGFTELKEKYGMTPPQATVQDQEELPPGNLTSLAGLTSGPNPAPEPVPAKPKRKRPSRAKKKPEQYESSGLKSGDFIMDVNGQTGIIKDMTEAEEPDLNATIAAAEKRHQDREDCLMCNSTGMVRDPESDDPLDTMTCPEC